MWDEIEQRGKRYLDLKRLLEDPTAAGSPEYSKWLREHGRLSKVGTKYELYANALASQREAEAILQDPHADEEFKALAKEELHSTRTTAQQLRNELIDLASAAAEEEEGDRNVIVEIHAGVGGQEAMLFVSDLFNMYQAYANARGWKLSVLDSSEAEMGGMNHVSFSLEGEGVFGEMRFEAGGHRVQRVPKTETQGRIHTSMARVAVMPEAEEVDVKIDPKDVRETFCASGGPGGQNVNKVASQCQLLHLPTGIKVHCIETRSQRQNQVRAWQILRAKLFAMEKERIDRERSDTRLGQIGSGDRSDRIRTYNFPQGRCTDHRLEGEDKNWPVQDIIDGQLEPLLKKLKEERRKQTVAG